MIHRKTRRTISLATSFILCMTTSLNSFSQATMDEILADIETNNTTLNALSKQIEAKMLENKTGIFLPDPELEFAYQWGDPSSIGPKKNISFKQSFAFPTVYTYQNHISEARNDQLTMEYNRQRVHIMLEAKQLCYDLIYANAMIAVMEQRLTHARRLTTAYERMLETGETNLLELNKVRINLNTVQQQFELQQIEREQALSGLQRLNGGQPVEYKGTDFPAQPLPTNFDQWYHNVSLQNPVLQWLDQEAAISQTQVSLARARSLPGFSAGYVSEALTHEQFRGWAVGISIPLWEQKNTVKLAQANVHATEEIIIDQQLQHYNQLKSVHATAISLQQTLSAYQQNVLDSEHANLLQQAWQQGEIGLIDYLMELSFYYDSVDRLLETRREFSRVLAVLNQYSVLN